MKKPIPHIGIFVVYCILATFILWDEPLTTEIRVEIVMLYLCWQTFCSWLYEILDK